jgi:hypothetical protein
LSEFVSSEHSLSEFVSSEHSLSEFVSSEHSLSEFMSSISLSLVSSYLSLLTLFYIQTFLDL